MQHFYGTIPGWFNCQGVYREMVRLCPDGGTIVEVGSFMGSSTAFLAVEARNAGRGLRVVAVDPFVDGWWEDFYLRQAALLPGLDPSLASRPMRECFDELTAPARGLFEVVDQWSVEAASFFAPGSVSCVFVDAFHDEDSVLSDLSAWWPAFDRGGMGVFGGHDYGFPCPDGVRPAVDKFLGRMGVPFSVVPPDHEDNLLMDTVKVLDLAPSWVVRGPA